MNEVVNDSWLIWHIIKKWRRRIKKNRNNINNNHIVAELNNKCLWYFGLTLSFTLFYIELYKPHSYFWNPIYLFYYSFAWCYYFEGFQFFFPHKKKKTKIFKQHTIHLMICSKAATHKKKCQLITLWMHFIINNLSIS